MKINRQSSRRATVGAIACATSLILLAGQAAVASPVLAAEPEPNLVLDYDFESLSLDSSTVSDKSGAGHDGRITNAGTASIVPREGGGSALKLSGGARTSTTAPYITVPNGVFQGLTETTVSAWVNWDGGEAFQWLYTLGKNRDSATFFTPRFAGDDVARSSAKPASNGAEIGASGSTPLPSGEWHNITTTITGDSLVYYLDGLEVSRTSVGVDVGTALYGASSPNSGFIGQPFWTGAHPFFDGAVDDFRVYDRALTASQVADLVGDSVPKVAEVLQTTVTLRTNVGVSPQLPSGVRARFSDGQERLAPVTWESVPESAYAQRATFEVRGTVDSTGTAVTATVQSVTPGELTIDVGQKTGDFLGGASGTLYGLYGQGLPSNNLIDAIKLRTVSTKAQDGPQHPGADALEVVRPLADSSDGDVYIYMTDIYRGFPYQVPGSTGQEKEADFAAKIARQVDQVLALPAEYRDNIVFVPFNEPEGNMYGTGSQSFYKVSWLDNPTSFFANWDKMYRLIKGKMPDARIAGPNTSVLFNQVKGFLEHTVEADTVPDAFTWHELSDPASIRSSVDRYRGWEKTAFAGTKHEGTQLPININEYAFNYHTSVPAQMIQWVAALEDKKVDGDIAYWNIDGNLSDSAVQANRGNGQWWLLQSYANMSGETVKVTPPRPNESYTLQGVATIDDERQQVRSLFGGSSGDQNVYFDRLPSYIGASAHVTIREIRWTGQIGDSREPEPIAEFEAPVVGGSVSLGFGGQSLPGLNADSAYEVVLSPGKDTTAPSQSPVQWRKTYEAESAARTGSPYYLNGPEGTPTNQGGFYTSGTRNVGGIEQGSTLQLNFDVDVPKDGAYDLSIFANGYNKENRNLAQGPVNMFVRVNGAAEQEVAADLGYKWVVWDHTDTKVDLKAGRNTITIAARSLDGTRQTSGAAIIDKLDLSLTNPDYLPVYEAENASLVGGVPDYTRPQASGAGVVNIRDGDKATFWVYSADDSEQKLTVDALGGGKGAVRLNGQPLGDISSSRTFAAFLVGGINKVEVSGISDNLALDRVTVDGPGDTLPSTVVEAESGTLSGSAAVRELSYASGGKAVGTIGGAPGNDSTLTTKVAVDEAGTYAMTVRYSNEEQSPASHYNPDPVARRADISVNGTSHSVVFPHSFHQNQFWDLTVPVTLEAGENTIVFSSEEQPNFDGETYASETFPGILLRSQYAPNIDRLTFTATSAADVAGATVVPAWSARASASGWWTDGTSLSLSSSKDAASVQYRIDGGEWLTYTAPLDFAVDGVTSVDYRAIYRGAPIAGSEGSVQAKVDRAAPTTTVTTNPASGSTADGKPVTATFQAVDAASGVASTEYSTNGGSWAAVPSDGVVFDQVGTFDVRYRSTDTAGNVEAPKSITVTVAKKAASAKVTLSSKDPKASAGWYTEPVQVTLAVPDGSDASRIQYRLDGSAWKTYTRPFSVSKNGQTIVSHRLAAGSSVAPGSEGETVVKLDRVAPTASITRRPSSGKGTPRNPVTITIAGADKASGVAKVQYRIGTGAWRVDADGNVAFSRVGSYRVSVRSVDVAGNTSPVRSTTVDIRPNATPAAKVSSRTVDRGEVLTLRITGFARWSDATVRLKGNTLATATTDANGAARISVRIPAGTPRGDAVLRVTGAQKITAAATITLR